MCSLALLHITVRFSPNIFLSYSSLQHWIILNVVPESPVKEDNFSVFHLFKKYGGANVSELIYYHLNVLVLF
jgi:hypothetical protein